MPARPTRPPACGGMSRITSSNSSRTRSQHNPDDSGASDPVGAPVLRRVRGDGGTAGRGIASRRGSAGCRGYLDSTSHWRGRRLPQLAAAMPSGGSPRCRSSTGSRGSGSGHSGGVCCIPATTEPKCRRGFVWGDSTCRRSTVLPATSHGTRPTRPIRWPRRSEGREDGGSSPPDQRGSDDASIHTSSIDLSRAGRGRFSVEWFQPGTGRTATRDAMQGR